MRSPPFIGDYRALPKLVNLILPKLALLILPLSEGQLLGQRAHGELLRPRQGRTPPKEVLDVRRCRRGNRGLHRLLQQLEAAGWSWQNDAFGIQGLLVGKAHMPSRPPRRGERKREPLARDSRFSIGRFLNVSLTWGPH